jgi:hypothetical protein
MSNIITLTDEQMKALHSGQSITIEPPKATIQKWEPRGGSYPVKPFLTLFCPGNMVLHQETISGLRYDNKKQAEQAAKAIRSYARQLAYLAENDDGWIADWDNSEQDKYFIYYHTLKKKYRVTCTNCWMSMATVYMSKENANKLCQLLNNEIVEF